MSNNKREYWVFVDKTKIGIDLDAVKIFGSVARMLKENITVEGKVLTGRALRYRLENDYWQNDRYLIKRCAVLRSQQKNPNK